MFLDGSIGIELGRRDVWQVCQRGVESAPGVPLDPGRRQSGRLETCPLPTRVQGGVVRQAPAGRSRYPPPSTHLVPEASQIATCVPSPRQHRRSASSCRT